jgi:two-component system LytT family response regulator/two-component system response regulator LytT
MDLRAVLVDDEQLARDELGYLLGQIGGVEVLGQAGNGIEALSAIERLRPDVVFLDVQMPGLTGFEVARRMVDAQAASHIIFVTAYDQHAIEAFEVNAVDYLLKPVDQARLEVALERARRRVDTDRTAGGRGRSTTSSRRSCNSSPNARAGANGSPSRSANASCWCRRRKSSTPRWRTRASPW